MAYIFNVWYTANLTGVDVPEGAPHPLLAEWVRRHAPAIGQGRQPVTGEYVSPKSRFFDDEDARVNQEEVIYKTTSHYVATGGQKQAEIISLYNYESAARSRTLWRYDKERAKLMAWDYSADLLDLIQPISEEEKRLKDEQDRRVREAYESGPWDPDFEY